MSVVSKTAETNVGRTFYVSCLAGPRLDRRRVEKGDEVTMSEHQARALLASGELVADKALVDDPFGDIARAAEAKTAADKAAAEAKTAADKAAAEAKIAADKAAAEAKAVADKAAADAKAAAKGKPADVPVPPSAS